MKNPQRRANGTLLPGFSGNPRGRKPRGCGTYGGYQRHKRYGEEPCEECKEARRAAMRAWTAANPDKVRAAKKRERERNGDRINERNRRWHKKNPEYRIARTLKAYGLTIEDRDRMLAEQGNRCAVCGTDKPGKRNWATDHDHVSGAVRGILCTLCNTRLGYLGDTLDRVRDWSTRAVSYLIDFELRQEMSK